MKRFIGVALDKGRFRSLFEFENTEIMKLVDQTFEFLFSEKFVDEGQTFISGAEYRECIEKIEGDAMADILREKFAEEEPAVTR